MAASLTASVMSPALKKSYITSVSSYFDATASYSTTHFFISLIFLKVASAASGLSQKSPASVFLFSLSTNSRLSSMSKIPPQSLYALAGFFNLLECYHYEYYLGAKIQYYLRFWIYDLRFWRQDADDFTISFC